MILYADGYTGSSGVSEEVRCGSLRSSKCYQNAAYDWLRELKDCGSVAVQRFQQLFTPSRLGGYAVFLLSRSSSPMIVYLLEASTG